MSTLEKIVIGTMEYTVGNKIKESAEMVEILKKRMTYNTDTGVMTWHDCSLNQGKIRGKEAGHLNKKTSYRYININKFKILAHRAAWAVHHGHFPAGYIDHINGDPTDNRLCNLRQCRAIENSRNTKMQSHNKSGFTGVSWHKTSGTWRAYIGVEGRQVNLGSFGDIKDAIRERRKAENLFGFTERHGRV